MNPLFTPEYANLFMRLLHINTISPMETRQVSEIATAQEEYAKFAVERTGADIVFHGSPNPEEMDTSIFPLSILECAAEMGTSFWESQPNMVLRWGPERPPEDTIMFNFHMDTVDGLLPISFENGRFLGRGAVDMKGPGVALLAGIEGALREHPAWPDEFSLLVQCVSGEEGGAMGVYGTKLLSDQGWLGSLNLFAEPSEGVYFDHSTTSMTARIEVHGKDSTDDAPQRGHNATLLLGYLAERLVTLLAAPVTAFGGKICLAGIHTGLMHNKVYGSGRLLLNFAYRSDAGGRHIRKLVEEALNLLLNQFKHEFYDMDLTRNTAKSAKKICELTWVKQGLPVLSNRHPEWEAFLNGIGWTRNSTEKMEQAFTCDAMWSQRNGNYTVVYGPGGLGSHAAHAEGEFITVDELEQYAQDIKNLLTTYFVHRRNMKELDVIKEYG
ncbi:M20/M25/M40 family metallo-hydrolase [Paenibacillus pini]|uniref:Acetylornithine deacetylase n=1 Tax=Paenibacillus pini JCM 16418 TaxID=1236976 RepID=W7YWZ9_9BACL|nr:M20/M25/M40 family metallo-hydrolase [Paenibacillus pini]GAF06924.1 acetylornithine deacetylase [Paenibacillus pini JCM 16418]